MPDPILTLTACVFGLPFVLVLVGLIVEPWRGANRKP